MYAYRFPLSMLPSIEMSAKASSPWESAASKRTRVIRATKASQNMRQLSGWNIFQRQRMAELGSLNPKDYKTAVKDLSFQWASLSLDDKQAFNVHAEHENNLRQQALEKPLPAKSMKDAKEKVPEPEIGSKALKRVSVGRLQHNFTAAINHEIWALPSQLGECILPHLMSSFGVGQCQRFRQLARCKSQR